MELIQIAISDQAYRSALREMLSGNASWVVDCVDEPDVNRKGVLVMDTEHLERLPGPLPHPDRVVLVTRKDPSHLSRAWEAGVHSVVYDQDPLSTAVLAIMSARLRLATALPGEV